MARRERGEECLGAGALLGVAETWARVGAERLEEHELRPEEVALACRRLGAGHQASTLLLDCGSTLELGDDAEGPGDDGEHARRDRHRAHQPEAPGRLLHELERGLEIVDRRVRRPRDGGGPGLLDPQHVPVEPAVEAGVLGRWLERAADRDRDDASLERREDLDLVGHRLRLQGARGPDQDESAAAGQGASPLLAPVVALREVARVEEHGEAAVDEPIAERHGVGPAVGPAVAHEEVEAPHPVEQPPHPSAAHVLTLRWRQRRRRHGSSPPDGSAWKTSSTDATSSGSGGRPVSLQDWR